MSKTKKGKKDRKSSIENVITHAFGKVGMWDFQAPRIEAGQRPHIPSSLR